MAETVKIGRDTIFGNPVTIGKKCPVCASTHKDAGSTAPCYQKYLAARLSSDEKLRTWALSVARTVRSMPVTPGFSVAVKALYQKTLYCPGCGVGSPTCHGRILEQMVNQLAVSETKNRVLRHAVGERHPESIDD